MSPKSSNNNTENESKPSVCPFCKNGINVLGREYKEFKDGSGFCESEFLLDREDSPILLKACLNQEFSTEEIKTFGTQWEQTLSIKFCPMCGKELKKKQIRKTRTKTTTTRKSTKRTKK